MTNCETNCETDVNSINKRVDISTILKFDFLNVNLRNHLLTEFNVTPHPGDHISKEQIAAVKRELFRKVQARQGLEENLDSNLESNQEFNNDDILYCFDATGRFVCTHNLLSACEHKITLPVQIRSQTSGFQLTFLDEIKLLIQTGIKADYGTVEIPWSYMCEPQMIRTAINQFGIKIDPDKVAKAFDVGSYISALIRQSHDFCASYGTGANFPSVLFSFSVDDIMTCICRGKDEEKSRILGQLKKLNRVSKEEIKKLSAPVPHNNEQEIAVPANDKDKQELTQAESSEGQENEPSIVDQPKVNNKAESPPHADKPKEKGTKGKQGNTSSKRGTLQKSEMVYPAALNIEMKDDLSFVIKDCNPSTEPSVVPGGVGSNLKCTKCKQSCKDETFTCNVCSLMVHYKCYPCQLYEDTTGRKKEKEMKRKPMAPSTFNMLKKIKNFIWRCQNCEDLDIIGHILHLATVALRGKVQCNGSFGNDQLNDSLEEITIPMERKDSLHGYLPTLRLGEEEYSIPSEAISDISQSPDKFSTSHTGSFHQVSPRSDLTQGEIEKTPEMNKGLQTEKIRYTTKTASIQRDSEDHTIMQERNSITTTDLPEHSDVTILLNGMEDLKIGLTQLKVTEAEHFEMLLNCLGSTGSGKRNMSIEEGSANNQNPKDHGMHRTFESKKPNILTTLHDITLENNNLLKDMVASKCYQDTLQVQQYTQDLYSKKARPDTNSGQTFYGYKQLEPSLKQERTVIVSGDLCRKLVCNSKAILHNFNTYFENHVKVKNSFVTKAGSLMMEFNEPKEAETVIENWKPSFFTGQKNGEITRCCLLSNLNKNSVIIKGVPMNLDDNELNIMVAKHFAGAKAKRFVTKDKLKLGTVKIDLDSSTNKKEAIEKGIKLDKEIFTAEEYQPRRRIIQCYNCLRFGHVAKLCKQSYPTCKNCGGSHPSTSCQYRRPHCCNCDQDGHSATDKQCSKFKDIAMKMNLTPRDQQWYTDSKKHYSNKNRMINQRHQHDM